MSLIYALIARKQVVLSEHTDAGGNFPTITRVVLRKIADSKTEMTARSTFTYDEHHFHFLQNDELVYLCMAGQDAKTTVVFALLEEMQRAFQAKYGDRGKTAIAYAMNDFSQDIKKLMTKYENNKFIDQFDEVHGKMNSVKNVMVENINKVLERGEKLDLLVDKTNNLQQEAFKFGESATRLKRVMWCKNMKLMFAIGVLAIVLMWLVASLLCGFDLQSCTMGAAAPTAGGNNLRL